MVQERKFAQKIWLVLQELSKFRAAHINQNRIQEVQETTQTRYLGNMIETRFPFVQNNCYSVRTTSKYNQISKKAWPMLISELFQTVASQI